MTSCSDVPDPVYKFLPRFPISLEKDHLSQFPGRRDVVANYESRNSGIATPSVATGAPPTNEISTALGKELESDITAHRATKNFFPKIFTAL